MDVVVIYKMELRYGVIVLIGFVNYNKIEFDFDLSEYLNVED